MDTLNKDRELEDWEQDIFDDEGIRFYGEEFIRLMSKFVKQSYIDRVNKIKKGHRSMKWSLQHAQEQIVELQKKIESLEPKKEEEGNIFNDYCNWKISRICFGLLSCEPSCHKNGFLKNGVTVDVFNEMFYCPYCGRKISIGGAD